MNPEWPRLDLKNANPFRHISKSLIKSWILSFNFIYHLSLSSLLYYNTPLLYYTYLLISQHYSERTRISHPPITIKMFFSTKIAVAAALVAGANAALTVNTPVSLGSTFLNVACVYQHSCGRPASKSGFTKSEDRS